MGAAITKSGVKREEIFLTTKVWIANAGEEKAAKSIDESLRKLQTDYIDLLLIHQAYGDVFGSWRAMEKAYKQGEGACHRRVELPGSAVLRLCTLCGRKTDGQPTAMQRTDSTAYYNEEGVGAAITKSGVKREEIFLTTKVWIANADEMALIANMNQHDTGTVNFNDVPFVKYLIETYG